MPLTQDQIIRFLHSVHPYDALPPESIAALAGQFEAREIAQGAVIYTKGDQLEGLYLIYSGEVEVTDENGVVVSLLGLRNSFGERGLLRDGIAVTGTRMQKAGILLLLPVGPFQALLTEETAVRAFFNRGRTPKPQERSLVTSLVDTLMTHGPAECAPDTSVQQAAVLMRDKRISSLCVTNDGGALNGILTTRDLANKVLAPALPLDTPVSDVMTVEPITLPPSAIGSDVLHAMIDRKSVV